MRAALAVREAAVLARLQARRPATGTHGGVGAQGTWLPLPGRHKASLCGRSAACGRRAEHHGRSARAASYAQHRMKPATAWLDCNSCDVDRLMQASDLGLRAASVQRRQTLWRLQPHTGSPPQTGMAHA